MRILDISILQRIRCIFRSRALADGRFPAVAQVFLTSRYLGIVMEYVTGGDLADMVDVWNVRNRKSHRARGPGEPIPHQCASHPLACLKSDRGTTRLATDTRGSCPRLNGLAG